MFNIVGINGSPKINNGASFNYLKMITNKIINSNLYNKNDFKIIKKSKIIIISFPLYVDSLPSHLVNFLNELDNYKINNKNIYVICNLGFLESKQGKIALKIINNFCIKTGNYYKGGLVIGGGVVGYLKYPLININIKRNIKKFKYYVLNNLDYKDNYTQVMLPRSIYIKCGNHNFNKTIKNNLLKKTI